MGALDDLAKKAQGFVEENKDQIQAALKSEKAEDVSDKVLDAVSEKIDDVTGGKHSDAIKNARDTADKHVGTE
ncbi:Rv0909 family putative TA system antitoxin [Agrococcus jejuensis]|uniref:Rv0909 family putative TA system antitoxin n=1 Tax=Agrococcus jejuensis TaxID=399736 RepID=UPI00119FF456|nr:Rv0909 family putative TA system antitoxin [Agrococcus jejuensis]